MFGEWKKTVITKSTKTSSKGKTESKTETKEISSEDPLFKKMDLVFESSDKAFGEFDKVFKQFEDLTKDAFKEEKKNNVIEIYGATKTEALEKANKKAEEGWTLISCDEDKKRGVWVATMKK